jgi:hypothetical protein
MNHLTLGEDHKLKMFENRAIGRVFGHEMEEVAGGWRDPHQILYV